MTNTADQQDLLLFVEGSVGSHCNVFTVCLSPWVSAGSMALLVSFSLQVFKLAVNYNLFRPRLIFANKLQSVVKF